MRKPVVHGPLYGRRKFCCKTVQSYTIRCKYRVADIPGVSNAAQPCEKERKGSFLNYKSTAVPACTTGCRTSRVACMDRSDSLLFEGRLSEFSAPLRGQREVRAYYRHSTALLLSSLLWFRLLHRGQNERKTDEGSRNGCAATAGLSIKK